MTGINCASLAPHPIWQKQSKSRHFSGPAQCKAIHKILTPAARFLGDATI